MRFLVDTSALLRIQRGDVSPDWDGFIERGLLGLCEPVLSETLLIADAKSYHRLEDRLLRTYPWATAPDGIWDLVSAIRRELVPHGAYRGLTVADLVIAATGVRLKLEVLHEDGDFETIARFVPQLRQRRITAGPG